MSEGEAVIVDKKDAIRTSKIIDDIEDIRSKNNINWMAILRIAIWYAPKETRKVLAKINEADKQISQKLSEL